MHTEEEAKQKWCPHVEPIADNGQFITSSPIRKPCKSGAVVKFNCIASDCMAWRWSNSNRPERPEGYCGLSGKASI